ncbi:MAG: energy transducer TonB [Bacteroidales bacterium]|nr:energy transducer TonB [Bacteroidales bacterium]
MLFATVAANGVGVEKTAHTVEKMPAFPGGNKELKKYLKSELRYPSEAVTKKKEVVYVQFTVSKDSTIRDIAIVRSTGDTAFHKEAIRVVQNMPKWIPAHRNGRAVAVRHTLPITFNRK